MLIDKFATFSNFCSKNSFRNEDDKQLELEVSNHYHGFSKISYIIIETVHFGDVSLSPFISCIIISRTIEAVIRSSWVIFQKITNIIKLIKKKRSVEPSINAQLAAMTCQSCCLLWAVLYYQGYT